LGEAFDPERFSLSSWNVFPCPRPPLPAGGDPRRETVLEEEIVITEEVWEFAGEGGVALRSHR